MSRANKAKRLCRIQSAFSRAAAAAAAAALIVCRPQCSSPAILGASLCCSSFVPAPSSHRQNRLALVRMAELARGRAQVSCIISTATSGCSIEPANSEPERSPVDHPVLWNSYVFDLGGHSSRPGRRVFIARHVALARSLQPARGATPIEPSYGWPP